jgi:hypothetical protein
MHFLTDLVHKPVLPLPSPPPQLSKFVLESKDFKRIKDTPSIRSFAGEITNTMHRFVPFLYSTSIYWLLHVPVVACHH